MNTINTPCLLYFYDSTGNLQHVIDKFKGLTFNRSWAGVGDFSLTLNPTKAEAASIKTCAFMSINNDVRRFGVITGYSEDYADNMYTLVISGVELKGIAGKRIACSSSCKVTIKQPYERVVYTLLNDNLINPTEGGTVQTARKLGDFTITYDSTRDDAGTWPTDNIEHDAKYNDLATEIKTLAETHDFGWYAEAVLTNGALTGIAFKMREGKDRTLSDTQTTNEPLIMSFDDNTVDDITYDGAIYSTPNTAVVGGTGTGVNRAIGYRYSGGTELTGINRNEKFVDARNSTGDEVNSKGDEALSKYGDNEITTVTPSVQLQNSFVAGEFNIGDKGTLRDYSKDMRLTTVTEIYEFGYLTLRFEFGVQKDNIASALSKLTANYENLVKAETATSGEEPGARTGLRVGPTPTITDSFQRGVNITLGTSAEHGWVESVAQGNTNCVSSGAVYTALQGKQNTLTAGNYISIVDNVISATPFDPSATTIPEPGIEVMTPNFISVDGVVKPIYLQRFKRTNAGTSATTSSTGLPSSYNIIRFEGTFKKKPGSGVSNDIGLPLNSYHSSAYRTFFRLERTTVDDVEYIGLVYYVGSSYSQCNLDVVLYYTK